MLYSYKKIVFFPVKIFLSKQRVLNLLKCRVMQHAIWVFTVCKSIHLGVFSLQGVKHARFYRRASSSNFGTCEQRRLG